MSSFNLEREFAGVREQLQLSAKLAGAAAHLRVDCHALRAAGRLDPERLEKFNSQWSGLVSYKGVFLGTRLENDCPIFGLFHDADREVPNETFSTAQQAVKAAVEYHRARHLSEPRYEVQYTPLDRGEYVVWCRTDSPDEAVRVFCANTALEGGALVIWDRHEMKAAARVTRTVELDHEEVVGFSVAREYLDETLAAIAQGRPVRKDAAVDMRMRL